MSGKLKGRKESPNKKKKNNLQDKQESICYEAVTAYKGEVCT